MFCKGAYVARVRPCFARPSSCYFFSRASMSCSSFYRTFRPSHIPAVKLGARACLIRSFASASPALSSQAVSLAPGVGCSVAVMVAGLGLADVMGKQLMHLQGLEGGSSPISGVPVSILLGLLIANTVSIPPALKPGLKFATTTLLRAGIVCVGIKLSLFDVASLGVAGVPVVLCAVGSGLLFTIWMNNKMGLSPKLGLLTAAGTSICGVTAIVSLAPAIKASEQEVAYAVANVVAFGLIGMLAYPILAHAAFTHSTQAGLFLGTAVHDTSQVMGAAMTYQQMYGDELVLKVAAVTKLSRNLLLAAVLPGLTWLHHRTVVAEGAIKSLGYDAKGISVPFKTLFPAFIAGFVVMAAFRTVGDATAADGLVFGVLDASQWKTFIQFVGGDCSQYLLGTAMSAVGLGTSFAVFKGVGLRPFAVGMAGALVVGATGFTLAYFLGPYVSLAPSSVPSPKQT